MSEYRILRIREVCHITGQCRTEVYRRVAEGTFPAPVKIGKRASGWDSRLVYEWVEAVLAGGTI